MESYSIRQLNFSYPEQERLVLNNINLEIESGQFLVFCGASGSGKTTLLRQLKTVLAPHGAKVGDIYFEGKLLDDLSLREQSTKIGFVMQSPDNQIVTDKVWHELAFGLESLGYDTPTIRLRVSEMASFFGIQNWFYKDVNELSGGQKQILNLAGIMVMQPSVLILDEPTSQLDPIAASDFLATLAKINRELGTTIILTEHRLEEAMPLADRLIVMDNGQIIGDGSPKDVGQKIESDNHGMFLAMPAAMRIYAGVKNNLECPITVREGRKWLDELSRNGLEIKELEDEDEKDTKDEVILELKDVWFKYEKDLPDVVKGASIKVNKGEFLTILGGNGTGKSTTLSLMSGINRPYRGSVYIKGKNLHEISDSEKFGGLLGVLPQNPQVLFVKNTVKEDLYEILKGKSISKQNKDLKVRKVSHLCDLDNLLERHPYDLSGGEQQRAALAKVLLLEPEILLLDEPTKGLDAEFKQQFAGIIRKLMSHGVSVVMISHDIEFCAKYASRCSLFFDGDVVTQGSPREFFSGNSFYTTSANRMARHIVKDAITVEDVILACGGEVKAEFQIKDDSELFELEEEKKKEKKKWYKNKFVGLMSLFLLIAISIKGFPIISKFTWASFTGDLEGMDFASSKEQWEYVGMMIAFMFSGIIFFLSMFEKGEKIPTSLIQVSRENRKLSKRTIVAAILILLCIPLTIFIGIYYLGDRKYYFISFLIILEVMLPFVMIFESRDPQARELVVISVLCAIGVAGRAAFFMTPHFKPVAAVVIISGVAFGAESGFLVGAVTMLLSNMLYSQGPWTPWQMFAMGILGFLAGLLFKKGFLRRDKLSLSIFGGVVVFLVYGGIMNPASVIMFQSNINWKMIATAYVTGVPCDLVHASATVLFLMIMGESMLEKLDRIKVKYGLVED